MEKTSSSHPLQIASVSAGPGCGLVGITFCPGKYDRNAMSGHWDRDLSLDLEAIRNWGAAAVVTLVEPKELTLLRVERLGDEVHRLCMAWFHLPIVDVKTPDAAFERLWIERGGEIKALLREGRNVLVHCRGGLGRAGMVAARLLIELGMEPKTAIAKVRAVRPGAIETSDQERYVLNLGVKLRPCRRGRDWFEDLMGFQEAAYDETRAKLEVVNKSLRSRINGASYQIGELELPSLQDLRERMKAANLPCGEIQVSVVTGDVRRMHGLTEYAGALFQVASQFNMLEMVGPRITPDDGVTRYQSDHTQGPACAIAAGAATVYRNYFAPVDGAIGQTAKRQLDGLADIGKALSTALGEPVSSLWTMQNGYALCSAGGLAAISSHLAQASDNEIDALRCALRIGLHSDVEVTDGPSDPPIIVSQAFCSALPVAYSGLPAHQWTTFARLVLEAAYEATLCAAALNAGRGGSNIVLLTLLGGGAFGNDSHWIFDAIRRALNIVNSFPLDVRIVSYGAPSSDLRDFVDSLSRTFA
jgi:protein-tyrosine phosphatase